MLASCIKNGALACLWPKGPWENLRRQRSERFYHDYVEKLVHEAKGLGLTLEQLLDLVRRGFYDVN